MAFKQSQAVALKSDLKYRGVVYSVIQGYSSSDKPMYNVQWSGGSGCFLYPEEMIITKEDADKLIEKASKNENISPTT